MTAKKRPQSLENIGVKTITQGGNKKRSSENGAN
jgi:hypothetical protein